MHIQTCRFYFHLINLIEAEITVLIKRKWCNICLIQSSIDPTLIWLSQMRIWCNHFEKKKKRLFFLFPTILWRWRRKKNDFYYSSSTSIVDIYIERQIHKNEWHQRRHMLLAVLINIYLLVVEGDRQIVDRYIYIYLSPLTSTIIRKPIVIYVYSW
jgi:hypothetical protein